MMMKKLISLLCVLTMVIGIIAVSAVSTSAAVDSAKTQIEVKNGQDVTYRLKLSEVESKVVGTDFSVYYDSSVLEPVSVLDFNDNDEENWYGVKVCRPNSEGAFEAVYIMAEMWDGSDWVQYDTLSRSLEKIEY